MVRAQPVTNRGEVYIPRPPARHNYRRHTSAVDSASQKQQLLSRPLRLATAYTTPSQPTVEAWYFSGAAWPRQKRLLRATMQHPRLPRAGRAARRAARAIQGAPPPAPPPDRRDEGGLRVRGGPVASPARLLELVRSRSVSSPGCSRSPRSSSTSTNGAHRLRAARRRRHRARVEQ